MKKHLLTKLIFILAILLSFVQIGYSQLLLDENFDYGSTAGDLTTITTNWTGHSGTTAVGYANTSLSMTGYGSTGIGGSLTYLETNSQDVNRLFTTQNSGTVYAAFLYNGCATGTGNYFFHFRESGGSFKGRLAVKQGSTAGKLLFAISVSGGTYNYGTTEFDCNTTYLMVVKYQFNAGASDDIASLFVLTAPADIEPTAETTSTGETDAADLAAVAVRQSSGVGSGIIDGIRVGTTWAEVAGPVADTDPPAATWNPANAATGIETNSNITITFDELIYKADGTTEIVNADLATLLTLKVGTAGGTDVPFTATYSNADPFVITINPTSDLAFATDYYVAFGAVYDNVQNQNPGENITFTTKPDTDKDSKAIAPAVQVPAATIESTFKDSFPVFAFTISDLGTADGLATKVTQITLKAGPNNTSDFTKDLTGGYLISQTGTNIPFAGEPVVTANSIQIPFALDALTIPDLQDSTYTVYLLLNDTVVDGNIIQLKLDGSNHGFIADPSGSEFAPAFSENNVGNNIAINVTATELQYKSQPSKTFIGDNLPEVIVAATDLNGNIDTAYVTDISITATGATLTGSPVSVTPTAGEAKFATLSFSDAGTGVTLTAASGALTNGTSNTFDIVAKPTSDIYFSEYIEGGGNNKALEIFNNTGASVDLADYVIRINSNGSEWTSFFDFPVGTTLPDGEVYVIAHAEAIPEILAVTDSAVLNPYGSGTSYVVVFNGDDVRALCKVAGTDTTIIDIIGRYDQVRPSNGWDVADVTAATKDHTLLRKVGITYGNPDWDWSAGTNENDSEWKVFDKDTYANLGLPTPAASSETSILTFTIPEQMTDGTITDATSTVDITVINGTDPSALTPTFTLSAGAVSDSLSGTKQDFTAPFVYTVTAEDAVTTEAWTVNVTVSPTLSTYADVLTMDIIGVDSVKINKADTSIMVYAPYGFDVASVKPTFSVSAGAAIVDTTTALDFSTPKTYTVTAQDGVSTKDWEVTVIVETPIDVANIAALRALYTTNNKTLYKITGEVTFTYATSPRYYIQDGTAALLIYSSSTITTSYNEGDNVKDLVARFSTFGDNMQLTPEVDPGAAISTGNAITAQTVTIAELTSNYSNYDAELIKLEEVTFVETGNFEASKNYTLTNANDEIALRTNFSSADYIGTAIPTDAVSITALAAIYYGTPQVYARSSADFDNAPNISGVTLNPTTPSSTDDVTISATITDDNTATDALTVGLFYGDAAGSETTEVTFAQVGTTDVFEGTIPASTTTVYYKITANDGTLDATDYTGNYSITVGINNPDGIVSMNIFPNPSNGQFTLEMNASKAGTFNVEIINIQGQVVYTKEIVQDGFYKDQIDISKENSGIYYIRVNDGNSTKVSKIMIQ